MTSGREADDPVDGGGGRRLSPRGTRELGPTAYLGRRRLVDGLLAAFGRCGYLPVATPAIEYQEALERGLPASLRGRTVRFIEPESGDVVALRADVTPQIARMVAARLGGELPSDAVVRLSYAADLVRRPDGRRERAEHHQCGVELIGDASPYADAEVIALGARALAGVGLREVRVDLCHTEIARGVLAEARVPRQRVAPLRELLARKDEAGVAELLGGVGVPQPTRQAVVALCRLFGPPRILGRARRLLACRSVQAALDRLEAVLAALAEVAPEVHERVVLDLGEVRGFDYYTGVRARLWAPGSSQPVAGGGRYDDLVGRYGAARPATGLAVDLDALEAALAGAEARPDAGIAVAYAAGSEDRPRAEARAAAARAEGAAFVLAARDLEHARQLARAAGALRLLWLAPGGAETQAPTTPADEPEQEGTPCRHSW